MMGALDELVEWLTAQLDDDERVAREAMRVNPFDLVLCLHLPPEVQQHNARHDPARVLRDVEANRRILNIHEPYDSEETGAPRCWMCGPGEYAYPCTTVRALALPYSDRPGYRSEWRP